MAPATLPTFPHLQVGTAQDGGQRRDDKHRKSQQDGDGGLQGVQGKHLLQFCHTDVRNTLRLRIICLHQSRFPVCLQALVLNPLALEEVLQHYSVYPKVSLTPAGTAAPHLGQWPAQQPRQR